MPREIYNLSLATRDTLEDNVKAMCIGWNKCKTKIYNILDETDPDPFPPFLSMYRGALRSGLSTVHWDTELEIERQRYQGKRPEPTVAQVHKEAFEAIDAMLEGKSAADQLKELRDLAAVVAQLIEGRELLITREGLHAVA